MACQDSLQPDILGTDDTLKEITRESFQYNLVQLVKTSLVLNRTTKKSHKSHPICYINVVSLVFESAWRGKGVIAVLGLLESLGLPLLRLNMLSCFDSFATCRSLQLAQPSYLLGTIIFWFTNGLGLFG